MPEARTPEGTWISCEENLTIPASSNTATKFHGYNFEVPADGMASGVPLTAMGRFNHEATATDPATGFVYETEDTGDSVLYRFRPASRSNLAAGGVLEDMKLDNGSDTRMWETGDTDSASWVTVDDPDPQTNDYATSTRGQAAAKGAALITRGEGAWFGNGVVYVVASNGGVLRLGQVFAYDPAASTFTCVLSSTSADRVAAPDNICVSPRGGIVLCEDGSGLEYLHGLTPSGADLPLRPEQRGAPTRGHGRSSQHREWQLHGIGVGRGHLRIEERELDVRQSAVPGHHLRHHRTVAERPAVEATGIRRQLWRCRRSPWVPRIAISSTGPSMTPNQCGVQVVNSTASPGSIVRSSSPRRRRRWPSST